MSVHHGKNEERLSRSPSPGEERRREEAMAEAQRQRERLIARGYRYDQVADLQTRLNTAAAHAEASWQASTALQRSQTQVHHDPREASRSMTGRSEIQNSQSHVESVLRHNGASDGSRDQDEGQDQDTRKYTRRLAVTAEATDTSKPALWNATSWLTFFGLTPNDKLGVVFEEMVRQGHKEDDSDIVLADELKKNIGELVKLKENLPENVFWDLLAGFTEDNQLTLADLVYFCQYIQSTFPLKQAFMWDKYSDKVEMLKRLKAEYYKINGSITGLIKLVPSLTYHNVALPRTVAANCAQLAMADLALSANPYGENESVKEEVQFVLT